MTDRVTVATFNDSNSAYDGPPGAAIGATAGLTGDAAVASLNSDFGDSVTSEMKPSLTAIVVEVDEKNTRLTDDIVALKGGHVYWQAAQ